MAHIRNRNPIDKEKVTVGTDCELFIFDPVQKVYISSVGKVGGMKGSPIPIGNDCGLEEDNVAVEFTVPSVKLIGGTDSMVANVEHCINTIKAMFPQSFEVAVAASAIFTKEELDSDQARLFGCDPDFNAWNHGAQNPRPKSKNKFLRSAGGHIHIGYPEPDGDVSIELIKILDLFVSVPAVLADSDNMRRELYGKAGCFRHKHYGFEYRTPSNFWVKSPDMISWLFRTLSDAVDFYNAGSNFDDDVSKVVHVINSSDAVGARELCEKYRIELPVGQEVFA